MLVPAEHAARACAIGVTGDVSDCRVAHLMHELAMPPLAGCHTRRRETVIEEGLIGGLCELHLCGNGARLHKRAALVVWCTIALAHDLLVDMRSRTGDLLHLYQRTPLRARVHCSGPLHALLCLLNPAQLLIHCYQLAPRCPHQWREVSLLPRWREPICPAALLRRALSRRVFGVE